MASQIIPPTFSKTKCCWSCKTDKPLTEFNRLSRAKDGLQGRCRQCGKDACRAHYYGNLQYHRKKARDYHKANYVVEHEKSKAWFAANPEKAKEYGRRKFLKKRYSLTPESFDAMLASQGGGCATCGSPAPNSKKGWSIDHCHVSGKVRGILCHHCNVGLGHAKDNIETLRAWIAYLRKHKV